MLELDDPTELRRKRKRIAELSRRRKFKATAKWIVAITMIAVGSAFAVYSTRLILATPDPLAVDVGIASFIGAYVGGIGAFTSYYLGSSSYNAKLIKLAKGKWTESLAPGIVAYAFGIPCSATLAGLLVSQMEFASIFFIASLLGSSLLFGVYWYLAQPLIPPRISALNNDG
ncbi:hypothetical protein [Rhodopirellula sp. MGV]|uniref:hypothetical protein n=1 Tax=Rhodopirellula sp. MGV TaxID=2023130 RepID=UPI00117B3115|nr:hypothetical protein [Rhodopirellula sp. MGV]